MRFALTNSSHADVARLEVGKILSQVRLSSGHHKWEIKLRQTQQQAEGKMDAEL